ncbi:MAG: MFS transporter [Gammaproteobacteria bacterium]|nr:MFS transporter [Gammaproteobacteria bacterium]
MKKNNVIIAVVLVAIVLDTMGMGLIFPLMPDLFLSAHSPILQPGVSIGTREFLYGFSLALWAGGIFFGSPFLGELSDRFGRRWVLGSALGLVALSYVFSYMSLLAGSAGLFLASRLLNGFFSSSFPLAQAIIIDISPEAVRARNLGWVVLAASIGFVFGPLVSATAYHFAGSAHGSEWTFLSAAVLATLNTLSIFCLLKDSNGQRSKRPIRILSVITTCKFVFLDKRVAFLTAIFFLMQMGWGAYVQTIPVLLSSHFGQTPVEVSFFYALIGFSFLSMTLWLQPFLLKRFPLRFLTLLGLTSMFIFILLSIFGRDLSVQWIAGFFLASSDCLVYTCLMALFSNAVNSDEQGRVMGGAGAVFGLTWGILALFLGMLLHVSPLLPIIVAAVATGFSVILLRINK